MNNRWLTTAPRISTRKNRIRRATASRTERCGIQCANLSANPVEGPGDQQGGGHPSHEGEYFAQQSAYEPDEEGQQNDPENDVIGLVHGCPPAQYPMSLDLACSARREAARHMSAAIAGPVSSLRNDADGRFPSRLQGVPKRAKAELQRLTREPERLSKNQPTDFAWYEVINRLEVKPLIPPLPPGARGFRP